MACLDRGELRLLSQAHAAAFAALAGSRKAVEASALEELARVLPDDHPMRAPVAQFCAVACQRFPTVSALQDAGRALRHAVTLHLMPAPVGQERADLNG